jgi:hypothetical protein
MDHELLARCETCDALIADGDGSLWVDMADVDRTATNTQAWEMLETEQEAGALSFSVGSLMSYPDPARWQVHHDACYSSPRARSYGVEVHRCRSWADLVWWTAHLMGKTWLQDTDWENLLQETAEATGTRIDPATPPKSHR